jgi:hypothetical protein
MVINVRRCKSVLIYITLIIAVKERKQFIMSYANTRIPGRHILQYVLVNHVISIIYLVL